MDIRIYLYIWFNKFVIFLDGKIRITIIIWITWLINRNKNKNKKIRIIIIIIRLLRIDFNVIMLVILI